MDGIGIPDILDAFLTLMPLDHAVEHPTTFTAVNPGDPYIPVVREDYRRIGFAHEEAGLREKPSATLIFTLRVPAAMPALLPAREPCMAMSFCAKVLSKNHLSSFVACPQRFLVWRTS